MTGWNVPRPTWSVTLATSHPRTASRPSSALVMCRPAVGAATAPSMPRVDGLVALGVVGLVVALDVRRQRDVAAARGSPASTGARREVPERHLEQAVVLGAPEQRATRRATRRRACRRLAPQTSTSVPNRSGLLAFPSARQTSRERASPGGDFDGFVVRRCADEEDLDLAAGVALAAQEPARNDSRVVDDDERPRGQQLGELTDATVLGWARVPLSPGDRTSKRAPSRSSRRALRDELGREARSRMCRRACGCAATARRSRSRRASCGEAVPAPPPSTNGCHATTGPGAAHARGELGPQERASSRQLVRLGHEADRAAVGADELPLAQMVGAREDDADLRVVRRGPGARAGCRWSRASSGRRQPGRRARAARMSKAASATGAVSDLEPLDAQTDGEHAGMVRFVVDDQHSGQGASPSPEAGCHAKSSARSRGSSWVPAPCLPRRSANRACLADVALTRPAVHGGSQCVTALAEVGAQRFQPCADAALAGLNDASATRRSRSPSRRC